MSKGILTSTADIEELRRLVSDGWSDAQIANHFGCCLATVYNRRREHNILRAKHVPPDVDADMLRELKSSGLTDVEIADKLGISVSQEKYYVVKYDCRNEVKHHITKDEMQKLVDDGMSDEKIAEKYGFTLKTIRTYRQRYGILRKNRNILNRISSKELIVLLDDGKSDNEIAKMLGVNSRAVEEFRRNIGMFHSKRIDIPKDELQRCIDAGMNNDEIGARYGCSSYTVYERMVEYRIERTDDYSYPERQWKRTFEENGLHDGEDFIHNDRAALNGKEIDFLFPEHNLGVEINPSITHASDDVGYVQFVPKPTTYHQKKALLAEKHGINLINVYDWNDKGKIIDIIKSNLGMTQRIGARKCSVVVPSVADERAFLSANHLQGYVKSDIRLGLLYNGNIVALMSFGKKRFNAPENVEYELLRYASLRGVTVVGGASRLFAHITEENGITSVISYASLDISNGRLYDKLGFDQVRSTKPSYMWIDPRNPERHYSWNLIKSRGVDNVLGTDIGPGNNIDIMLGLGFVRVYNAGSKVYLWEAGQCQVNSR